jgi:hypothetical protein
MNDLLLLAVEGGIDTVCWVGDVAGNVAVDGALSPVDEESAGTRGTKGQ